MHSLVCTDEPTSCPALPSRLPVHVAMLTSYVPPHQLDAYQAYSTRFERFSVLISTPMERHRQWQVNWGSLDVQLQRTWTFASLWKHNTGFTDAVNVHVPIDTIGRLRKLSPDVVVSGELGIRSLGSAIYKLFHPSTPLILWVCVSEHTEQGRGWLREKLRKWLVRRADAVIVNGSSGRRYMNSLGMKDDLIFEVPYPSPSGFFDQCPLERNGTAAHRLLYVGQLSERKGLVPFMRHLVQWAATREDQNLELLVVGTGPELEKLQSISLPANLRVDFLGLKSHEELKECYSQAGILVFPTLADEWGLVVNEAMAAGMPVLGSLYSGSVEELCTVGETGWTFRPDDENEVFTALSQAFDTDENRLNEMRRVCRERSQSLSPSSCADRFEKVVEVVLNQRKKGTKA